jgi:hypothetical protein
MAFPQPALFAGGPPGGSTTLFTVQPIRQFWVPSPVRGRVDYGIVQHGRDELHLVFSDEVPIYYDEAQQFRALRLTAIANAGKVKIKFWDDEASSGAGAWAEERFLFPRPAKDFLADGTANVYGLELVFRARGLPL